MPWPSLAVVAFLLSVARPGHATAPPLQATPSAPIVRAFQDGLFSLPAHSTGLTTQFTAGTWRIPIVLVSFADDTIRYSAHDFERMVFDTTHALPDGSVAEYWRTVSGGRLRLTGRVIASVRLPETQAYYANHDAGLDTYASPQNDLGVVRTALNLCQATVTWPEFDQDFDGYVDMVWFVHAGTGAEGGNLEHLWSITSRMSVAWYTGGYYQTTVGYPGTTRTMLIDRFTMLPEESLFHPGALSEIGVYAHEFGHALGLPDLYNILHPQDTGPGNWSLMSSGAYGGDGHSPDVPTLPGAWPLHFLGWDHALRPSRDTTLAIQPLERSADVVDLSFQGESAPEHFLIENRQPIGYDRNLPAKGLIVYHVNEPVISFGLELNRINAYDTQGLTLVEADGQGDLIAGRDRGDSGDPFPGSSGVTRIDDFTHPSLRPQDGTVSNLVVDGIAASGEAMLTRLRVRSRGWLPPRDMTGPGFAPLATRPPSRASGRDASGIGYVVNSEYVASRQQIVLRSSEAWDAPQIMSHSSGAAVDPSLAFMPSGDLALVWSDSRHGRFEIYYRSRIRGVWTDERPIVSLPGTCRGPSIAADGRGGLAMAFQFQTADSVQILFERFNYVNPIGQPLLASAGATRPDSPLVLLGPDGHGYLMWSDRRGPGMIWFSAFHPDSGLLTPQVLSTSSVAHSSYVATLDSSGGLHVLWSVSGPSTNQIWYHGRGGTGPEERVLENLNSPLESMAIEADPQGSVHVAYGISTASGIALRYRRRWPGDTWDTRSTDLSYPAPTSGGQPRILPGSGGNLDVVYTGNQNAQTRFMVLSRVIAPGTALARDPSPVAGPEMVVAPNPARAGNALVLSTTSTTAPARVEVYDAQGRRIATMPVHTNGARAWAVLDDHVTAGWTNGVYFARLAGSRAAARRFVIIR